MTVECNNCGYCQVHCKCENNCPDCEEVEEIIEEDDEVGTKMEGMNSLPEDKNNYVNY